MIRTKIPKYTGANNHTASKKTFCEKKRLGKSQPLAARGMSIVICSYDVVPSAVFCVYAWQFFSAVFSLQNPCFLFLRLNFSKFTNAENRGHSFNVQAICHFSTQ